ncbi:MAG: ABC transporter ATP-binding protein [bacterium]
MLKISSVTKRFGSIVAVDQLSIEVIDGEIFGLLGPNGAGKTTTVNISIGILRPDSGSVLIGKIADPSNPKARSIIGVAPQLLSIYESLTVEENLDFFGRLYGLCGPGLKQRIGWCLDTVGLLDRRKSLVRALSGGMMRRLNLAVALINDPLLLILDEPTLGVDAHSRNMILEKIVDLKKSGKTVLYTTHYMEEAQKICDRVGIIDNGKMLALDTVEGLISAYGGKSTIIVETASRKVEIETEDPVGEISRICSSSKPISLSLKRPDLEQVFLNLTGRHLRDK